MNKLNLTEEQQEALDRLDTMLIHNYFPTMIKALEDMTEDAKIITYGDYFDMSERDKKIYALGYGKAVYDITMDVSRATEGWLPDNKTLEEWSKEKI